MSKAKVVTTPQELQQALKELPGKQLTLDSGSKVRVVDGIGRSPASLDLEVLHEQPGLAAWVGRRDQKGRIVDAVPVFTAGEYGDHLSPMTAGAVLLTDLARDLAVENRYAGHNFAVANAHQLTEHFGTTFGPSTLETLQKLYLGKVLGPDNAKFLTGRMVRILRVNYLDGARMFEQDKTRIRLKTPFALLTKFESNVRLNTLLDLAVFLGERWLEAESHLISRRPNLADRQKFFSVVESEAAAGEADQVPA